MPDQTNTPPISLLWPPGTSPADAIALERQSARDLGCLGLAGAFQPAQGRTPDADHLLNQLSADPTVLAYRQDVLDESLSSTSAREGLYLAQDVVRVLRLMGVRAVFVTHLHELAAGPDALNAETPGDSPVLSLVTSRLEGDSGEGRSYRVLPGPSIGRSYARELATRYGVSLGQLIGMLRARGVLHFDQAMDSEDS